MTDGPDEFYVGYLPRAPSGIASRSRAAVVSIFALAAVLAFVLVSGQEPFGSGVFEFGVETQLSGVLLEEPYPMLLVPRPGRTGQAPRYSTYLLSVFGKRGAASAVDGFDGRAVRLSGSLIYRDGKTMVEVVKGSIAALTDGAVAFPPRDAIDDLGRQTLVGEIVDSKCYLGVMKPGNLKPHRSCATRCISGGIPPVFVVRDGSGIATYFLLVSATGKAVNREVLEFVAEPVRITGRVLQSGDLLVLQADPRSIRKATARDGRGVSIHRGAAVAAR